MIIKHDKVVQSGVNIVDDSIVIHTECSKEDMFCDDGNECDDIEEDNKNETQKKRKRKKNLKMKSTQSNILKVFSANAAGIIGGKFHSLKNEVSVTNANIVTVQETHCRRKGKIQLENFISFEAIRKTKGGGTLIAIHKDLKPKLVEEYSEEFELLSVNIKRNQRK